MNNLQHHFAMMSMLPDMLAVFQLLFGPASNKRTLNQTPLELSLNCAGSSSAQTFHRCHNLHLQEPLPHTPHHSSSTVAQAFLCRIISQEHDQCTRSESQLMGWQAIRVQTVQEFKAVVIRGILITYSTIITK